MPTAAPLPPTIPRIVLVQPRNPLNILAAARAARNFGLGDIVVAEVHPPAWAEALEKDADRETPHGPRASSRGWLGDARKCDTLLEAIGDCDWVLGTTSLERRKVAQSEVIELPDLPTRLAEACGFVWPPSGGQREEAGRASGTPNPNAVVASGQSPVATVPLLTTHHAPSPAVHRRRVAILFGSEKRGLTNEHLMRCHHLLHIPTLDAKPSMNLGQAVAVVCYELARSGVMSRIRGGQGRVLVKPSAECAKELGCSADTVPAAGSEYSKIKLNSGSTKVSKINENKELSGSSEFPANAAEIQALVDQVQLLLGTVSVSSDRFSTDVGVDARHRNLVKMLIRLPLTGEDVRRILGVIKDAKNASAASSAGPKKTRRPQRPKTP